MKIKIDKDGNFWIERAGTMKLQECHMCPPMIYNGGFKTRTCSDSCSLFNDYLIADGLLELCRAELLNLEVTDERGGDDLAAGVEPAARFVRY